MKHLGKAALALVCLLILFVCTCACAEGAAERTAQIQPEVIDAQFELNPKTGFTVIGVKTRFTNESDVGIMEVKYSITVYDAQGEALAQVSDTFNGLDTPIAPGESIEYEMAWQSKLDAKAHHAEAAVTEVRTEAELPPVHLPKPGEPLYQALGDGALSALAEALPTEIELYIDRGGDATIAVITDAQAIREAVELLMNVKIAKETQEWVTDNYNSLRLSFADGSEVCLSFNLWNLEICPYGRSKLYELENLKPFVNYMLDFTAPEEAF